MGARNSTLKELHVFPLFIPDTPEIWLAQMESAFNTYGITCLNKRLNAILSNLNSEYAKEVKDLLLNPPDFFDCCNSYCLEEYEVEKQKLLLLLHTHNARCQMRKEEIGDQQPSEFLNRFKIIAGEGMDNTVKEEWINKLPNEVQEILRSRIQEDFDSLGALADSLITFMKNERAVDTSNQVASSLTTTDCVVVVQCLAQVVDSLRLQIGQVNKKLEEIPIILNSLQNTDQLTAVNEIIKPD